MPKDDVLTKRDKVLTKLQVEIRDVEGGPGYGRASAMEEGWPSVNEPPEKLKERIRRQAKEWEDRAMEFIVFGNRT